jgi:transposase
LATSNPAWSASRLRPERFYRRRQFEKLGHSVKIVAPQYVKPFARRQKNGTNDAEAICTALQQHNMRFVPKKTLEQQDVQALHRARKRLVNHRTALISQIRGYCSTAASRSRSRPHAHGDLFQRY